jgi:hypothetical protein
VTPVHFNPPEDSNVNRSTIMTDAAALPKLSPKQNAKVERLADAIEDLAVALAANLAASPPSSDLRDLCQAARDNIRVALREFLVPALHLMDGGARQDYTADVETSDRVKCGECGREKVCSDTNCPHWHKAIGEAIQPKESA